MLYYPLTIHDTFHFENLWTFWKIGIWLLYNVVLVSAVQWSESAIQFSSVQSLSCIWLFATPGTAARQASLPIINSWSLLKLMSVESVMPSNLSSSVIPFSSYVQSFPASGYFPMNQFFSSGSQNIGVSASALVLPMNIQDWFPLGLIGLISLQSYGVSRVFLRDLRRLERLEKILERILRISHKYMYVPSPLHLPSAPATPSAL